MNTPSPVFRDIHARIREADVLATLKTNDHEIKEGLATHLRLRRIPRLHYTFDETEENAAQIEQALHEMKEKGEL